MSKDDIGIYVEINVEAERGADRQCVYAHSKDVPGLHLFGKCLNDMKPMIERAIKRLYKDNHGISVREVIWLKPSSDGERANDVLTRLAVIGEQRAA